MDVTDYDRSEFEGRLDARLAEAESTLKRTFVTWLLATRAAGTRRRQHSDSR